MLVFHLEFTINLVNSCSVEKGVDLKFILRGIILKTAKEEVWCSLWERRYDSWGSSLTVGSLNIVWVFLQRRCLYRKYISKKLERWTSLMRNRAWIIGRCVLLASIGCHVDHAGLQLERLGPDDVVGIWFELHFSRCLLVSCGCYVPTIRTILVYYW